MVNLKRFFNKLHILLNVESLLNNHRGRLESFIEYKVNNISSRILYNQRKEYLIQQVYNCKESGINPEKYCDYEVIVSLSTHGNRFYDVHMAIESIMQQTLKPNRIILNVAQDEFAEKTVPTPLCLQQKRGLEINYCEDYLSFKKIIPTLRRYPEAIIITIDDDCLYNFDMIENMIYWYKTNPSAVWGNIVHKITFDETNNIKSYMDWDMNIDNTEDISNLHFITSVGGVLYPPHSLHKEVIRDDIFMELCKTNDDIWCYAMMILAGTPICKVRTHSPTGEEFLPVEEMQNSGLWLENTNFGGHYCKNDEIIKRVFDKYKILDIIRYRE